MAKTIEIIARTIDNYIFRYLPTISSFTLVLWFEITIANIKSERLISIAEMRENHERDVKVGRQRRAFFDA